MLLSTLPNGPPGASAGPRAPERFGRYILLEKMGEGGMAEVFGAVVPGAEGFRRQVVLKRILAGHASSPTFVEMFAREARISAILHHPNIVQVFDFGQVDGSYFLAMELLDGWELGAINRALRRTGARMPIEVALHIAHQVLLGLSYAHTLVVQGERLNIVHRDVSPSNVMCLRAGGVKLLDFGVASTAAARAAVESGPRSFCGKLSYSAPEYVRDGMQDARIDLFAVGIILWESLVGERLFRCRTEPQTLAAVMERPIVPPSVLRPAVPAEIDRIVLKALERDPARRYQTAAAMAEDLEQVLSDRRYQSQALPRLLGDLFGNAPTHVTAVTAIEALLKSGSTIPPAPLRTRVAVPRPPTLKSLRRGMTWGLAGTAVLLLTALLRGQTHVEETAAVTIVPPPPLAPLIEKIDSPPPAAAPLPPAPMPTAIAESPRPARVAKRAPWRGALPSQHKSRSHNPRAATLDSTDLIGRAQPIDPFSEAASRQKDRSAMNR